LVTFLPARAFVFVLRFIHLKVGAAETAFYINIMNKTIPLLVALSFGAVTLLAAAEAPRQAMNPIIHADVPDIAVIRVGETYYMSSTTMHMNPGLPIMKSKDLVNWELVSYAYETLVDNDAMNLANGRNAYGAGSWASSFRHHNGTFYVTTFSSTSGRTHVYRTKDIEKGPWVENTFRPSLHDHSLFFDEDDRVYMLYGGGNLRLVELNADLSGLKEGGFNQVVITNAHGVVPGPAGLVAEGSQLYKHNGKYYLFNICWPRGGMRTVVIHRADKLTGPWEGRLGLQDKGVAQGCMVDTPTGEWFAYLFRDFGAVGRIPYLVPMKWEDGWPVIGVDGKVPDELNLSPSKGLIPGLVASDEFDRQPGERPLPLVWQWNHNPDPAFWSLSARPGYLRLTTGRVDKDFLAARNTLTQRTIGPESSGVTAVDISNLKDGDFAGLALLQRQYGLVGVKAEGGTNFVVMVSAQSNSPTEIARVPLNQKTVFLKADCDFKNRMDRARFYYSLDGQSWTAIGNELKMSYTLPHFMGYRFGLFNYATKEAGGSADFDYFRLNDKISSN
jgi:beta-xylosidase